MGDVEHANRGVQAKIVHSGNNVPECTAYQQRLDGAEEVRHTPHLLVLQFFLGEIVDESDCPEDSFREFCLEVGWVDVVLTDAERLEEGRELLGEGETEGCTTDRFRGFSRCGRSDLQSDLLGVHDGISDGLHSTFLGKLVGQDHMARSCDEREITWHNHVMSERNPMT